MAAEQPGDVESLLRSALRPIEPPENLSGRLEETLSAVTEAAATELSAWAEELSESELRSLRDPRNWVRPAAAIAAGESRPAVSCWWSCAAASGPRASRGSRTRSRRSPIRSETRSGTDSTNAEASFALAAMIRFGARFVAMCVGGSQVDHREVTK